PSTLFPYTTLFRSLIVTVYHGGLPIDVATKLRLAVKPGIIPSMNRKLPKTEVVAFKVEKELADLLNKLPNKSAFIRKAIAAQLGVACPLCQGKGVVPRGVHDHFTPLLARFSSRSCDGCGDQLDLPLEPVELDPERR